MVADADRADGIWMEVIFALSSRASPQFRPDNILIKIRQMNVYRKSRVFSLMVPIWRWGMWMSRIPNPFGGRLRELRFE
jgi:hypothetical protein